MADFLSVANMALGRVGEPYRLTDPNEDTHPARTIRTEWDNARKAVLRRGKLNFAMTRAALTAQAPTDPNFIPPDPYGYRFPLPPACVRFVEILSPASTVEDYADEGRSILSNSAGPLIVRYVRDVVEIGDWDDLAVEALAERLGYAIADTVTGDLGRKRDCWSAFLLLVKQMRGPDAKEEPPLPAYDSSWLTARCSGPVGGPPNV